MGIKNDIERYVEKKIHYYIQTGETSSGKATLAMLRRGIGRLPGDMPELWGSLLLDMPESLYGKGANPGRAEWACYTALTLYALHQQGNEPQKRPMHKQGESIGAAMRRFRNLADDSNAEDRVLMKMRILASGTDIQEIAYRLRSVIEMLKGQNIPLDYAMLAGDVYLLQSEETAPSVRLRWGREFYYTETEQ